jgi:tetratricopeptide (TPR) repeat protein
MLSIARTIQALLVLSLIAATAWLIHSPGFDQLITLLGIITTLLGLIAAQKSPTSSKNASYNTFQPVKIINRVISWLRLHVIARRQIYIIAGLSGTLLGLMAAKLNWIILVAPVCIGLFLFYLYKKVRIKGLRQEFHPVTGKQVPDEVPYYSDAKRRLLAIGMAICTGMIAGFSGRGIYLAIPETTRPTTFPTVASPLAPPADTVTFLVADFEKRGVSEYNVAGRIYEMLERNIGRGRFPKVFVRRIPVVIPRDEIIADPSILRELGSKYDGRVIIWGSYDDAGFVPYFTLVKALPASVYVTSQGGIPQNTTGLRAKEQLKPIITSSDLQAIIPYGFEDTEIAQVLGLFQETKPGIHTLTGDQLSLNEQPAEQNIQPYIREALPTQMAFLAAITIGYIIESTEKLEAFEVAIKLGEDISKIDYLANSDYWDTLLGKIYSLHGSLVYVQLGDTQQSIADLTRAIQLSPNNPYDYSARSHLYLTTNEYSLALADINISIQLQPQQAEAYIARGAIYAAIGDRERSLDDMAQSFVLNADTVTAYTNRCYAFVVLDEYEKAIDDCDKAIQLEANNSISYLNRGNAHSSLDHHTQAIDDYTKAIELQSSVSVDSASYKGRGQIYRRIGDYERALVDFSKAIELQSGYAEAYIERGMLYRTKGNYEAALSDLTTGIELQPAGVSDYVLAYIQRGLTYSETVNYEQSIVDFSRAIELQPEMIEVYRYRALVHSIIGNIEQAKSDLRHILDVSKDPELTKQAQEELRQLEAIKP